MNTERMGMPHVHQMPPPSGLSHDSGFAPPYFRELANDFFHPRPLGTSHTPRSFCRLVMGRAAWRGNVHYALRPWQVLQTSDADNEPTYLRAVPLRRDFSPSNLQSKFATSLRQRNTIIQNSRTPSLLARHVPHVLAQRTRHTIQPALVSAIHTRQRTAEKHISVSPPFSTKTHMGSLPMIGSFEFPHVHESMCTALGMTTRTSVYAQHPQGRLQLLFHCP